MSNPDLESLIAAWLDGRIDEEQSSLLQKQLMESSDARKQFRRYANLDASIRSLATDRLEINSAPVSRAAAKTTSNMGSVTSWLTLVAACGVLILVGGIAYTIGLSESALPDSASLPIESGLSAETRISGHATLRRAAGIKWSDESNAPREGDLLPAGLLEFGEGLAEIDFFCGATLVVEGPARLDLESDWSVRLLAGRLRATVPPAARGFTVKAADAQIIDLGTEFALSVSPDSVQVAVVDGEIKLKGGKHDGQHLLTGETRALVGESPDVEADIKVRSLDDVDRLHGTEQALRLENWKAYSEQLSKDDRLIAYYPIAANVTDRFTSNKSAAGNSLDGKLVGPVQVGVGRFGVGSKSLDFGRPGSRVRSLIPGKYEAFTFACWAKVDSLDHTYNALFMSDGYENGELHWQIKQNGQMMFSVMVDDTPGSGGGKAPDARFHRIYYTEPIWDVSKSGKWMHLAAVYDPENRVVEQFVDGVKVSREPIQSIYYVQTLKIGPAEIGNWGQPLRKSPSFAVRNLNGAIDEMAVFKEPLSAEEIRSIYDNTKPFAN